MNWRSSSRPLGIAAVVALGLPLFFWKLGAFGLTEPDEPYYAVPALEMLTTGTWRVPVFHGEPWFDKPVFFYWVVLTAYHVFGVSEFSARFGAALSALAGSLSLFFWRRDEPRTCLLGAIVLASSLLYVMVGRIAITDSTFTLFLTVGMLAAARCFQTGSGAAALLGGAAIGLAVLTKGPAGLLLPGVALLAYSFLVRSAALLRPRVLGWGVAGLLATAVPWYLYMFLAHRDLLVGSFLAQGNLGRFLDPEHPSFPLYYVVVLLAGLLPWSGALPSALFESARETGRREGPFEVHEPGRVYLLCWFGAVLLVFSLSASKLPTYVLPACPPAALLIAEYWTRRLEEDGNARTVGATASAALSVAIAAAVAAGLVVVARKPAYQAASGALAVVGALLVGGTLSTFVAVRRRSWLGLALSPVGASLGAVVVLVLFAVPSLEPVDSTRPLARALEAKGIAGDVVGTYRIADVGLDYYLGRAIPRVGTPEALREAVRQAPGGVWVVSSGALRSLRADPRLSVEAVEGGPKRSAVRLSLRASRERP